jgi:hypothetical protein
MKTFAQFFCEGDAFIINSGLLDFWIGQLIGLLKNQEFILNSIPNCLSWLSMGWRVKS